MAKLFDEIKKDNPQDDVAFIKDLNVFLSRVLFCFFAEDTNIFGDNQFTNALASHTKVDGSDLNAFFDDIFDILNTHKRKRGKLAAWLDAFPYVNGGLFESSITAPTFTRKSRQAIIAAGELNWKDINPDIFGSMFQAVIGVEQRGSLGQHYTSVPNIMKVIEPLFLNDLYEEYDKAGGNSKKLNALLNRIASLKIFDPACGSGNFLIIAYKELRRLEIKIFQKLKIGIPFSAISLTQFYGIEIDAFAVEIAQLSLWLAEHQMNVEFFQAFGKTNPTLPLKQAGHIVCANACRIDWEEVCPKGKDDEIYILGNPPFKGNRYQTKENKEDIKFVCGNLKYGNLDYISCWFVKASRFIKENSNSKFAFVSTNSITQGAQVELLWPFLFSINLEIYFAHNSFKWQNNAKSNAGVHCIITGIRVCSDKKKLLFNGNSVNSAKNINAYLMDASNIFIQKRKYTIHNLGSMDSGNKATDGGNLLLNSYDKELIIKEYPESKSLFRNVFGAHEFLNGSIKFCLWINEGNLKLANSIDPIRTRIEKCRSFRQNSSKAATRKKAETPYRFDEVKHKDVTSIFIPTVTSERRIYLPCGFFSNDDITLAPNNAVFDPEGFELAILSSKIHMVWVKTVAGKLESG